MSELIGQRVGRYRLEEAIGRGGMAEVYAAHDEVLDRRVAVKLILPVFAADEQFLERFLREARLVAALDHPNILTVYDFGESGGRAFLVMPFLPGGTLVDRLRKGPQPLVRVINWIGQLAVALDAAHEAGILHRDVKPGNALFAQGDRLVLSDFGIARACESSTRLTATGVVVGTPAYMAPELARGAGASPASDRYSLAVVAYELLCGAVPFDGENALSILHQQVHEPVPPLGSRVPGLPSGVETFFQRALAKQPDERPTSCGALAEELVGFLTEDQLATFQAEHQRWPTPAGGFGLSTRPVPAGDASTRSEQDAIPTLLEPSTDVRTVAGGEVFAALTVGRRSVARGLVVAACLATAIAVWWAASRLAETGASVAPLESPGTAAAVSPSSPPAREARPEALVATAPSAPSPAPGPLPSEPPSIEPRLAEPGAQRPKSGLETPPAERPEVSAGEALSVTNRRLLETLRRPTRALTPRDFDEILDVVRRGVGRGGGAASDLLRSYGEGGLAYAGGDDAVARRHLEELRRGLQNRPGELSWLIALALGDQPSQEPWELAVAFADARGEGQGEVDRYLAAHPSDRRARLGRAYLRHLAGDHREAARAAEELLPSLAHAEAESAAVVVQFLVLESLELGDETAVRRWLGPLTARKDDPRAVALTLDAARFAALVLNDQTGEQLVLEQACDSGMKLACARGRTFQPRRRRPAIRP